MQQRCDRSHVLGASISDEAAGGLTVLEMDQSAIDFKTYRFRGVFRTILKKTALLGGPDVERIKGVQRGRLSEK